MERIDDDGKLTYTVKEAARLLGICTGNAYEFVRRGMIPSIRLDGRILIPRRALEEMVDAAGQTGGGQ